MELLDCADEFNTRRQHEQHGLFPIKRTGAFPPGVLRLDMLRQSKSDPARCGARTPISNFFFKAPHWRFAMSSFRFNRGQHWTFPLILAQKFSNMHMDNSKKRM